jgi:hypothetical protein
MAVSAPSSAACNVWGKVGTIWSYNNTNVYFGIQPNSLNYGTGYVYYFRATVGQSLYDTLMNAAASDETVYVSGNATSCPTPSAGGIYYGGVATYVFHSDYR